MFNINICILSLCIKNWKGLKVCHYGQMISTGGDYSLKLRLSLLKNINSLCLDV